MRYWQVPVTIDGHAYVLVLEAENPPDALAQLARHRARTAQDPTLHNNYVTGDGGRIDVRWGRAAVVDVGPVSPAQDFSRRNEQ
jgi:hypothetical protein